MSDVRELYQDVILDHGRRPRNFGTMENPSRVSVGHNPLCGDRLTLYVLLADGVVQSVRFEGSGCAISTASASLLTEMVAGKTTQEIREIFRSFKELVTSAIDADVGPAALGKLAVFAGVREFPVRVKCATLAWHTLDAALSGRDEPITTE